jgi:hypothetical protein
MSWFGLKQYWEVVLYPTGSVHSEGSEGAVSVVRISLPYSSNTLLHVKHLVSVLRSPALVNGVYQVPRVLAKTKQELKYSFANDAPYLIVKMSRPKSHIHI